MATSSTSVITLPITAPILPKSYRAPSTNTPTPRLTPSHPSGHRTLLPVGPAHLSHLRLALHHSGSFDAYDAYLASIGGNSSSHPNGNGVNGNGLGEEDDFGVGDEEEGEDLLSLDPKEWKKQDHYRVLGLSKFRWRVSPEQIKVAHRKKVLKHHPDKKASTHTAHSANNNSNTVLGLSGMQNTNTNDDAFFKCIQKAHEVLTNPEKKRQFDSVDPEFLEREEELTGISAAEFKTKKLDFFKTFAPIFDLYSRFSRTQPVPQLGTVDATKEEVEGFYDAWYNFDSWRSFEWWDKEVNEGSDSRDDKRYTEKKNKSERARRKKEDIAKLRGLVDLTLSLDPRIKMIKQQEKEAREAKKAAGNGQQPGKKTKAQLEEEKKKEEEEKKRKEEEEKVARAEAKKAKAAAANAAKKARRQQRAADGE